MNEATAGLGGGVGRGPLILHRAALPTPAPTSGSPQFQLCPLPSQQPLLGPEAVQGLARDAGRSVDAPAQHVLADIADDFVESVTVFAAELAKHRGSNVLTARDLQRMPLCAVSAPTSLTRVQCICASTGASTCRCPLRRSQPRNAPRWMRNNSNSSSNLLSQSNSNNNSNNRNSNNSRSSNNNSSLGRSLNRCMCNASC